MKKYLLFPGFVRSETDGDCHFIGARQLADLYSVPFHECIVGDCFEYPNLISLRPRRDGEYRRPDGTPNLEHASSRLDISANDEVRELVRQRSRFASEILHARAAAMIQFNAGENVSMLGGPRDWTKPDAWHRGYMRGLFAKYKARQRGEPMNLPR